jgi:hypothetical protein
VNSLVLIEIIYDLFRLLRTQFDPRGAWSCRVSAWNFKQAGAELHSGYRRGQDWGYQPLPSIASGDDYHQAFSAVGPAERDAFECIFRIYGLWGFGNDAIPFSRDNQISPAEIQALRN